MTLGFKEFFDKKKTQRTYFRERIYLCTQPLVILNEDGIRGKLVVSKILIEKHNLEPKLHTIREGDRWKAGDLIHMAYGVRTKKYVQFNKGIPSLQRVVSVQKIEIKYLTQAQIEDAKGTTYLNPIIKIDDKVIFNPSTLAKNDGFSDDPVSKTMQFAENKFLKWFNKDFTGQIIHWTDLKY